MAYQSTIVKCHSDFEGSAWMAYDRAFKRQAAAKKTLNWSQLNPTLYSLCFAGKVKTDILKYGKIVGPIIAHHSIFML